MNERIKELAQQCWDRRLDGLHFDQEKFAQFIVQECIDIIAFYSFKMSKPSEEYLHPILEIKQHFGIES